MYPTRLSTIFNTQLETAATPELRRMATFDRARREEMHAMLVALTPRKLRKSRHNG